MTPILSRVRSHPNARSSNRGQLVVRRTLCLDFKRLRCVLLHSMQALTIQDVSRRSGLSEPTLRYYEEVGLIGPIARERGDGDAEVEGTCACGT